MATELFYFDSVEDQQREKLNMSNLFWRLPVCNM